MEHEDVTSGVYIITDLQGFHMNIVLSSDLSAFPSLELLLMFQDVLCSDLEEKKSYKTILFNRCLSKEKTNLYMDHAYLSW